MLTWHNYGGRSSALARLRTMTEEMEIDEHCLLKFFAKAPYLFGIVDRNGFFNRTNIAWNKILGWTAKELAEKNWLQLVHEDDVEVVKDALEHLSFEDVKFICRMKTNGRCGDALTEFSATKWDQGQSNTIGRLIPEPCSSCPVNEVSNRGVHAANQAIY